MEYKIINNDCLDYLNESNDIYDLSFLDPPFNQGKNYNHHNDQLDPAVYWKWMFDVSSAIYKKTSSGGAIYFMQREKNTKEVIEVIQQSGWNFQNLIIWKKKSSAVPSSYRYGKQYQIIVFATKGKTPRVFNRLRIDPPLLVTEKIKRENGIYVTDVWDDIRELTSGYFAGDEPLRDESGKRCHEQQAPLQLLLRIILSSSKINDTILDPFSGTGTTSIVASQLSRNSIAVEKDPVNVELIKNRFKNFRKTDNINKFRKEYLYTENLDEIWYTSEHYKITNKEKIQLDLL